MSKLKKIVNNKQSAEYKMLVELFNFIIPPSVEKKIPGAAFLLNESLLTNSVLTELLKKIIHYTSLEIQTVYQKDFSSLTENEKLEIFKKYKAKSIREFNELSFEIIKHYYTNKLVLLSIGAGSIPPFPQGNNVKEGDLYLLEQVFTKGEIYRK